jgi:RES domain-containing protein
MELTPAAVHLARRATVRMIPARYPSAGILDQIASPGDLDAIFELEGWTNDRISNELGIIHTIPRDEWVVGAPLTTVVMAAYCHPRPGGGRFNDDSRGAWYAAFSLKTAHAEAVHARTRELEEIGGWFETAMQMAAYLADFNAEFHDLRGKRFARYLHPDDYAPSQRLAQQLLDNGANGIVYPSVRDRGGTCIACFRPKLVRNVRQRAFYEYRWTGAREPAIRKL